MLAVKCQATLIYPHVTFLDAVSRTERPVEPSAIRNVALQLESLTYTYNYNITFTEVKMINCDTAGPDGPYCHTNTMKTN